ncbi:hypothetical protein GWM34_02633, partial [Candida africana]
MSTSIADAFKKLNVSPESSTSEHEKIFNVSYEYLSKVKKFNDLKASKNCLVALINLDKYYKAEQIIRKLPSSLVNLLILEVAYVYYKIGKVEELVKLYEATNENTLPNAVDIGLKHVLAQSYYKIGSYEKALELYKELIKNNQYDDELDLVINEKAIVSQLNFQKGGKIESSTTTNANNYDLLFNEALIKLSTLNTTQALALLDKASQVVHAELSGEDLVSELLPIKLTTAYVYQLIGESNKSLEILESIDVEKINDLLIKLIVKNNLYSHSTITNINLVDRDLNYQQNLHKLSQKLTVLQYERVLKNSLVLKFASGTLSKSQLNNQFINNFQQTFPGDLLPLSYKVLSTLHIDHKDLQDLTKLKQIGRKLVKYIPTQTDNDLKIVATLILVSVNAQIGSFDQSLPILEQLTHESLATPKALPGLIGTLIAVYENTHNTKKLTDLLLKVLEKLLYTPKELLSGDINYYNFAKIVAFKALNQGHDKTATQLFEYLYEVNSNDQLIHSILSNTNNDLLPLDELTSKKPIHEILSVDIDTLIPTTKNKPIKPIVKKVSKITKKKQNPKFGPNKVLKPIEDLQLDEERWLPMKLRSYYKPTKKEKKKASGGGGGQQGATESSTRTTSLSKKKKKKGKK